MSGNLTFEIYPRVATSDQTTTVYGACASTGLEQVPLQCVRVPFAASAQDVTCFAAVTPAKIRIVDVVVNVDTNNASETVTLRDASGGGGNALSAALSLGAAGRVREATAPANRTLAAGGQIFLRRNTTVGVGDVTIYFTLEQ